MNNVKILVSKLAMIGVALVCNVAMADVQKLSGKNSDKLPEFTVEKPWTMDWSARSDFLLLASIEIRLHDATTGEYLGMVAEIKGTGDGLKVFEQVGTFQIVVIGNFVEWDIEIEEVGAEQAAELTRSAEGKTSFLDSVRRTSRLVPEGSFESWRPLGNERLQLFNDDGIGWRVSFSQACTGLESATAISFVMTADDGNVGQYDSILLSDGTRCYFDSAIPDVVQR